MSWEAAQWAEQKRVGTGNGKAVLLVLANASKSKDIERRTGTAYQCTLSHLLIAERSEVSLDTTQRTVARLHDLGLVLHAIRYDRKGRRTSNIYFLNVGNEDRSAFAARVGIPIASNVAAETKPQGAALDSSQPKPRPAAKSSGSLSRNQRRTKPHRAGDHYIEPGLEPGESTRHGLNRASELPRDWTIPDEWRRETLAKFDVTADRLSREARKFANHYQNLAEPRRRKAKNWRAVWDQWVLRCEFADRSTAKTSSVKPKAEVQRFAVESFREGKAWPSSLGPKPDQPGCVIDPAILVELGFDPARLNGAAKERSQR